MGADTWAEHGPITMHELDNFTQQYLWDLAELRGLKRRDRVRPSKAEFPPDASKGDVMRRLLSEPCHDAEAENTWHMWFKLRVGEKTKRTNREDYCSPKKVQLSSKQSMGTPGHTNFKFK